MKENRSRFSIGFSYAWSGLLAGLKKERNLKIHFFCLVIVLIAAYFFRLSKGEWIAILIVSALVIQAELFNSVVERIIDYVKPEKHPQAKLIKDMAAGAVLTTAFFALIIAMIIFIPKVFH